jgi:hypothetical protein
VQFDWQTDERGFALVGSLIITAMILALGAIGVQSSSVGLSIATNDLHQNQAMALAEGGVAHAMSLIEADSDGFDDELAEDGTAGALATLGSAVSIQGRRYRHHPVAANGDGYYVRIEDNFDESGADDPTTDLDQRFRIVSRGRVGGAERVVQVLVSARSLFPYAAWAQDHVQIPAGGIVDSYDSRDGPYGFPAGSNGDLYSDGFLSLDGGATQLGDASAAATITLAGGASISGAQTPFAPPLALESVDPCTSFHPDMTGITAGGGTWSYDPMSGDLHADAGATIVLADGAYCFHDVTISGGSSLLVNGPVQVSMSGTFDASGGVITNTTSIAANLQVFVTGGQPVRIAGGPGVAMALHARTSAVTLSGGGDFFGAIVAGGLDSNGGTNLHYDEALRGILTAEGLEQELWREVQNS